MDFKEILSVSGKPGLYKIIAHTKNGLIVESLTDKKRIPVYTTDRISNLEDISIFTTDKEKPLVEILKLIYEKENGEKSLDHKSEDKKLKEYFEQILPDYDKDRVYASDIRKVFNWYNQLIGNKMLDFTEKQDEAKPEEKAEDIKPETEGAEEGKKQDKAKKETPATEE
ncbi:MAG: DUF5606 domain-containing protein [Bacteroidales bacterium]|jgi:hypothetical protein|nr:DUF5606 domain-containing protein [Bacteroidales bacterium]MDD4214834.1 DUF5606 domain-containing protein [Bacteroidales bacterium]